MERWNNGKLERWNSGFKIQSISKIGTQIFMIIMIYYDKFGK
jgi:hypothetical protein